MIIWSKISETSTTKGSYKHWQLVPISMCVSEVDDVVVEILFLPIAKGVYVCRGVGGCRIVFAQWLMLHVC